MRIMYDEAADILRIEVSPEPIVRDVSHGWHVSLGYAAKGLAEITILDARAHGAWPIEIVTTPSNMPPPESE